MPKTKLENTKVRTVYYELSDKISQAKTELSKLDNPLLDEQIKKLEEIRDTLYNELESKYLWD